MLVVLYFHQLGYNALEIASLFLLYEFFGVITNLMGGWLAARLGLNVTMHIGLGLQIIALAMLLADPSLLTVVYVMVAQAISGIAKDLNKMSAKSSIKTLLPNSDQQSRLYQWVAVLTGSKNALKGVGFFLGSLLLAVFGFQGAVWAMVILLGLALVTGLFLLQPQLGKMKNKPPFAAIFSTSTAINRLSTARFFLFASRDIWFVVALPVYLQSQLDWGYTKVGMLMASWVIVYGMVQSLAPKITGKILAHTPDGKTVITSALILAISPVVMVALMHTHWVAIEWVLVCGLFIFGVLFAINSAIHSFLIVDYAKSEGASLDIGFYYMANAGGRLLGTLLSGGMYVLWGLPACLLATTTCLLLAAVSSAKLPRNGVTSP